MIHFYITNDGFQVNDYDDKLAHFEKKDGWTLPLVEQLIQVMQKLSPEKA